jgi:outer membrane protein TolC
MTAHARLCRYLILALLLLPAFAKAQESPPAPTMPPSPMTVAQAVDYALAHNPAGRAQAAIENAAAARLDIARARYLPRGDLSAEETRGTGNVVPGSQFSMPEIPQISGPPRDRVFDSGVWGSAAGAGIEWDVAHLSQQMARADAALAERNGARAGRDAEALTIAYTAADTFAAVVAAGERLRAAQASLERSRTFQGSVDALVRSGLRPGADGARAAAETALAETAMVRAREAEQIVRADLARALGAAGAEIEVAPGKLAEPPPAQIAGERVAAENPYLREADAAIRAARANRHAAVLDYVPRVEIAAALWGRGNGLFPGGAKLGYGQGLVPDTPNWAAGMVLSIPLLQFPEIRAGIDQETAKLKLAEARRDEVAQEIESELRQARAILDGSYEIARSTRVSVDSSRAALAQAGARYRAGLYTVDAVAEALRLMAQAQADDAVAAVEIWRARLLLARAVGDLEPLLAETLEASRR